LVELVVDQRHGLDAALKILKNVANPWLINAISLQSQDARDHLKVVLDPVMNLSQQHFLLGNRGAQLRFIVLLHRDVLDFCHEDAGLAVGRAHERTAQQDPYGVALLVDVALLEVIVGDFTG
jgi:hypothetical protein